MDAEAIKALLEAARGGVGVVKFDPEHAIGFCPDSYQIKDLAGVLTPPDRPKQALLLLTADSFVEYVNKFGNANSALFANELKAAYEAVLDYHPDTGQRGFCDHLVRFVLEPSAEFQVWMGYDNKLASQDQFARFIESNLADIQSPSGAEMLQIALSLQVRKDANFVSDLRLDNGQIQLRYEEQIRGTTKAGDMELPQTFVINIPIFTGGPKYQIEARLRYRVEKGTLGIGYELIRADKMRRLAVEDTTIGIAAKLKATSQVYLGGRT